MDLVQRVRQLVGRAAQERARHVALLLVRGQTEVRRIGGGIAIVGEAGAAFAGNADLVVHDAARAPELRGHDDHVHAPFGVQIRRRVPHGGHQRVQIRRAPAVGRHNAGRHRDVESGPEPP